MPINFVCPEHRGDFGDKVIVPMGEAAEKMCVNKARLASSLTAVARRGSVVSCKQRNGIEKDENPSLCQYGLGPYSLGDEETGKKRMTSGEEEGSEQGEMDRGVTPAAR